MIVEWKTGTPKEEGVYFTTLRVLGDSESWAVLTSFKNGEWLTSGEVIAWDYRPEPYSEKNEYSIAPETSSKIDDLEWQIKDLEASWSEIHGEMKYYEGAAEALHTAIKLILRLEED